MEPPVWVYYLAKALAHCGPTDSSNEFFPIPYKTVPNEYVQWQQIDSPPRLPSLNVTDFLLGNDAAIETFLMNLWPFNKAHKFTAWHFDLYVLV